MTSCQHSDKTVISVEVDSGLIMTIDSHCNICHDIVRERDKCHAAFVPDLRHDLSMIFDVEHLGVEANLIEAAVYFIGQLKERKAV